MSTLGPWQAVKAKLSGAGLDLPVVWPNDRELDAPLPYLQVEMESAFRTAMGVGGLPGWYERGELRVYVITEQGSGVEPAATIAGQIAGVFAPRPGEDPGAMTYSDITIGAGEQAGALWLTPVIVQWLYQSLSAA